MRIACGHVLQLLVTAIPELLLLITLLLQLVCVPCLHIPAGTAPQTAHRYSCLRMTELACIEDAASDSDTQSAPHDAQLVTCCSQIPDNHSSGYNHETDFARAGTGLRQRLEDVLSKAEHVRFVQSHLG